jgi:hypothetical protein
LSRSRRPERGEVIDYFFTYIDRVGDGDVVETLRTQESVALAELGRFSEARSRERYAPGKWSIREVVGHVNDVERMFAFRAFWFARIADVPLPSFDHERAALDSGADARPFADHLAELRAVRASTCALLDGLAPEAWDRNGIASGNPFSVRGIAWIVAGHLAHHLRLLKEQYP